ncbi:MAG: LptE family protein [Deltaproteobacteria bacterium]|nr:LptE family protein [Deltaproteobacteria bacterium]
MRVLLLALAGCGYRFTGTSSLADQGIRRVAIPVFTNATAEPRIEQPFTESLIREFTRARGVRVTTVAEADATVEGAVKSVDVATVTLERTGLAQEYRVTVYLDVKLRRARDGQLLWHDANVRWHKEYQAPQDPLINEDRKRDAIQKVAEELGRELYFRISGGF